MEIIKNIIKEEIQLNKQIKDIELEIFYSKNKINNILSHIIRLENKEKIYLKKYKLKNFLQKKIKLINFTTSTKNKLNCDIINIIFSYLILNNIGTKAFINNSNLIAPNNIGIIQDTSYDNNMKKLLKINGNWYDEDLIVLYK